MNITNFVINFILVIIIFTPPVFAYPSKMSGIVVISDIHIRYGQDNDPNRATYYKVLDFLSKQTGVTDIIVNGDIFDAKVIADFDEQKRLDITLDFLTELRSRTGTRVHFNMGNHEIKRILVNGSFREDFQFTLKLKAAIMGEGFSFIGSDYKEVYEYRIGSLRFLISHAPFVTTDEILAQSKRMRSNKRSYKKITEVERIKHNDGIIRICGDSHTPLIDTTLNVYNVGRLADTPSLSHLPNTFLNIRLDGSGQLLEVPRSGIIQKYHRVCSVIFGN